MAAAALCVGGCGDESPTKVGELEPPTNITGVWNGTWLESGPMGYISMSLVQHADSISGEASIGGGACMASGDVTGLLVGGRLSLAVTSGDDSVFFNATYGKYRMPQWEGTIAGGSGNCTGSSALFSLQKTGSFIATVASPVDIIPSTYQSIFPFHANMVVGGGSVYWYEGEGKALKKVPTAGGIAQTLAAGFTSDFAPIAIDDENVYVADSWTIKKVPINGGAADSLAQGSFYVEDIATDSTYVYWIEKAGYSEVKRVPIGGGPVEYLGSGDKAGPMCVVGGYVYFRSHNGDILRVPAAGGTVETVADDLPFLADIISDGEFVFFAENDTGWIRKIPVGGGPITPVFSGSNRWSPYVLALNASTLFWINQAEVGMVPKSGGNPRRIVGNIGIIPFFPEAIAIDGGVIYWTETVNRAIRSVTP